MTEHKPFCWKCRRDLAKKPKGGYYETQRLINGHMQRLHLVCATAIDSSPPTPHLWPSKQYDLTDDNH